MAPSPFVIGVGFELSRLDELPVEAHDRRMDRVLTERTGGAESVRSSALT
jgi:5-formyltetrahydrofolate cyclo-ligase